MTEQIFDDELSQMYEESEKPSRVLDAATFQTPIKHLKTRKPIFVSPGQSVADAINLMQQKRLGCVAVTEHDKLVGAFAGADEVSASWERLETWSSLVAAELGLGP